MSYTNTNTQSNNVYAVSIETTEKIDTFIFTRNNEITNYKLSSPFGIFDLPKSIFPVNVDIDDHSLLELDNFSITKIKK
jgi:hypothetical protein